MRRQERRNNPFWECQPLRNDSQWLLQTTTFSRQLFDATGSANGPVFLRVHFLGQFGRCMCICPLHLGVGGQLMARQDLWCYFAVSYAHSVTNWERMRQRIRFRFICRLCYELCRTATAVPSSVDIFLSDQLSVPLSARCECHLHLTNDLAITITIGLNFLFCSLDLPHLIRIVSYRNSTGPVFFHSIAILF